MKTLGNTAQRLCASCAVDFFVSLYEWSADNLTIDKRDSCKMTEKDQAYRVQRPWAGLCAVLPLFYP